jgi:hypothetical protein
LKNALGIEEDIIELYKFGKTIKIKKIEKKNGKLYKILYFNLFFKRACITNSPTVPKTYSS